MMKPEFETLIGREISDEEWYIVETVYMHYPNMTKNKIVQLYAEFGMVIFKDLYPRAQKIKDIDNEIYELQAKKVELMYGEIQGRD